MAVGTNDRPPQAAGAACATVPPAAHVVVDAHAGGETMRVPTLVSSHRPRAAARRREMETAARGFGTRSIMIHHHDAIAGLPSATAERSGMLAIGSELGWGASLPLVTVVARPAPWPA